MIAARASDLEWHEQIARRIEASRNRPIRVRDLIGAVAVSAVVLGLGRSAARTFGDPGGPPLTAMAAWLTMAAVVGLGTILGLVAALGLGRASTSLHGWGKGRPGPFGSIARASAILADLVAFGLLMAIALGVTLFLMISILFLAGAFA